MKTGQELYTEHWNRLAMAASLQKTDRTPIYLHAGPFAVRQAGGKMSDLVTNIEYGQELALKGLLALGDIDGADIVEYPVIAGVPFLGHTKLPGRDLPEDMQWQIDERGEMTEADYDTIINKGWNVFFADFCQRHLGNALEDLQYFGKVKEQAEKNFMAAGVVQLSGIFAGPAFGAICGGRSISKFMRDLHKIPDKVEAALEAALEDRIANFQKQIRSSDKQFSVILAVGRGAGDFLTRKAFDRFVWPHIKKIVEVMVAEGVFVHLHMDMSWDRFLDYFLELPKGKCIFAPDGSTNMAKVKEVLAGHMCVMGDVPAALLTLGTPDEVYRYSKRLVDDFAPTGFIMGAGCCVPLNANPENVKAMVAAAIGK
ncbi:MAG: uroporphyrinogen-III decarboxylase-like protein [Sporomusa sp.]|jgi:hypothetical protein|nr:uroporphyrinogen-III decarboxylase-like protein [Sporomusa sp.]